MKGVVPLLEITAVLALYAIDHRDVLRPVEQGIVARENLDVPSRPPRQLGVHLHLFLYFQFMSDEVAPGATPSDAPEVDTPETDTPAADAPGVDTPETEDAAAE